MARANAHALPPEDQVTPEQLQMAYRQLWRPHWPATLEACLRHPLHSRCIRLQARLLSRPGATAANRPTPHNTAARLVPLKATNQQAPQAVDFKRLAGNDRDDDE
jgi:hypothetical protein